MPSAWTGFDAYRVYRGVRYAIHVERKGMGNKLQLKVDGKTMSGTVIKIPLEGIKEVLVNVSVGE